MGFLRRKPAVQSITSLGSKPTKATPKAKGAKNLTGTKAAKMKSTSMKASAVTESKKSEASFAARHPNLKGPELSDRARLKIQKTANKNADRDEKKQAKIRKSKDYLGDY